MSIPYLTDCVNSTVSRLFNKPDPYQDLEKDRVSVDEKTTTSKCTKCTILHKISQYTPQLQPGLKLLFKNEPRLDLPLYHQR